MSLLKIDYAKFIEWVFGILMVIVTFGLTFMFGHQVYTHLFEDVYVDSPFVVEHYRIGNNFEMILDKSNNVVCYIKENKGLIYCVKGQ